MNLFFEFNCTVRQGINTAKNNHRKLGLFYSKAVNEEALR